MPGDWSASGDFSLVTDSLEELVHRRAPCGHSTTLPGVWRFSETTSRVWPTTDALLRVETEWHLPTEYFTQPPVAGDQLVDSSGDCARISRVERLRGETRFRCIAVRAQVRPDAARWFDLQQADWGDLGSGPEITGWSTLRKGLRGCLDRTSHTIDATTGEETSRLRVGLTEVLEAGQNHRLVDHQGQTYRVTSSSNRDQGTGVTLLEVEAISNVL